MSNFKIGDIVRPTFEQIGLGSNDIVHIGLVGHYKTCRSLFKVTDNTNDHYITVECLRCHRSNEHYPIRFKLYSILVTLKDTNGIS